MKRVIISIALIVLVYDSTGQESNGFKLSIFYAEFFGNTYNQISINYERVFSDTKKIKVGFRGGLGIDGLLMNLDYDRYAIVANMFGFTGQKKSHLEFGAGLSFLKGSFVKFNNSVQPPIPEGNSTLYMPLNLSYRFQPPNKGIFFRAGFHPFIKIIDLEEMLDYVPPKFTYTFGLAVGYSFSKKIKV